MTTINPTYILIDKPYVAAGMRARSIAQGRDITNSQVTAEQTAAIIEREVGRLLQLALAAAQIPGVTPASGSVYALGAAASAPSADTVADAVRVELATELGRIDAAVSSRLASAGYTAPANADIAAIKATTDALDVPTAGENAAAILAAAQITPIHADLRKINAVTVDGTGVPGNEWGPA